MREIGRETWVETIGGECTQDHDCGGVVEAEESQEGGDAPDAGAVGMLWGAGAGGWVAARLV